MVRKEECIKQIKKFREKRGVTETSDENVISAIHLMNSHGLDVHAAEDQSSRGANDLGIDAWFYDSEKKELYIYQSKLSENKALVLNGFKDLLRGAQFLENVLVDGELDRVPNDNHCLYGLYMKLAKEKMKLKKIYFSLVSLFDENEIEDLDEYKEFQKELVKSRLNKYINEKGGKLISKIAEYNLEGSIPTITTTYEIDKFEDATIQLRSNSFLHLSYVSLYSLITLYRQRGDALFDKNVRLSLMNQKEAKDRLVHPLEATLDAITTGELKSSIFPFYHIGVTISATSSSSGEKDIFALEAPSVINGCQTITIANHFLKKIEKEPDQQIRDLKFLRFKEIQVICKVVEGVSDEELKEITNANNRQNPIENWQLFSNEPIHIAIEHSLKDIGIFYERQKGKFDSLMKIPDSARYYQNTNGTKISIYELGQVIALGRKDLQKAAKPAEIFVNKKSHEIIFDRSVPNYPFDIVFACNVFKCLKNGLNKYLNMPTHAGNDYTQQIFKKPIIRINSFHLALIYYYQNSNKWQIRHDFSTTLLKKASPILSEDLQSFYMKIINKIRTWYLAESKNFSIEPSQKKMESFFTELFSELGLDRKGVLPFSSKAIDWTEYKE